MPHLTAPSGVNWFYDLQGDDFCPTTLLMIHGFGGSSVLWQQQVDYLLPDYRVLRVDLPGHGQSSWLPVHLDALAVDLKFLLETLKINYVAVVASSFGGMVTLKLFDYDPYRIHRMVLVGALPRFARDHDYPAGLDITKIRKLSGQFDGDYASVLDMFFRSLFSRQDREEAHFTQVRALWKQVPLPQQAALKYFLDVLEQEDLRELLIKIQCPVQIIHGTEDMICPSAMMPWLKDAFDNARVDTIEGAGHLPFLSRPDDFNAHLERFI